MTPQEELERIIFNELGFAINKLHRSNIITTVLSAGYVKLCHPKDICDVCWTSSWAPCPKDYLDAQQVIGKEEWVFCQMCKLEKELHTNYVKKDSVKLDEEKEIEIHIVNGVEGKSISINGYRVAGSKPWGGGNIIHQWKCSLKDILEAIPELNAIAQAGKEIIK